jgi:hypothetical protein
MAVTPLIRRTYAADPQTTAAAEVATETFVEFLLEGSEPEARRDAASSEDGIAGV